ncbi:glycosyltransferase [Chloroflexus sp.]|uniref:glycosyltransferase family 4 protein n=1 Tax=Chloroflexus sp. TaxID=1904827 RepID=UPI00298F0E08|nr:glycosyltransferase [Chloroflexus sp.]MDW8403887.1 glycosyltransferase [Chloroflexus sp.]
MRVGIVLTTTLMGGVQKRFAQLLSHLSSFSNNEYTLILQEEMLSQLQRQRLLLKPNLNITILPRSTLLSVHNRMLAYRISGRGVRGVVRILSPIARRILSTAIQDLSTKFDILHYCTSFIGLNMPRYVPLVTEEVYSYSAHKPNRQVLSWLTNGAYVSCLTETIAQKYKQLISDSEAVKRIFVAPCSFIDYSRVSVAQKERLIAFSGRMEKLKNPELFVSAIEILAKRRKDFRAVMLGYGSLQHKVDHLISKKNMSSIVSRYYSTDPLSVLRKASIFVSLQEFDNYPSQALMEGMASGCAVIASDRGETKKLVTDDVGFLVPLCAEAIAERMNQMLDQYDKTIAMGQRAREKVMEEHTVERYTAYLEGIYKRIIQDQQQKSLKTYQ